MANVVRKIEAGTITFLVLQFLFVAVSAISFRSLVYRINHFDYGKMKIDEQRILDAVQFATKEFLHSYQTNVEDKAEIRIPKIDVVSMSGVVCATLRRQFARIDDVDYCVGDYMKSGTNLYQVALVDFDRQRVYCVNDFGDKLICCLTGPKEDEESRGRVRTPVDTRASGERREGGRVSAASPL